jgi:ribosomal protein S18 acetylase RimI-like enzyme
VAGGDRGRGLGLAHRGAHGELTGELTAQVDPAHPALADEVLDWAAASRVEACETEEPLVKALRRRGFRPEAGPFMVGLSRSLAGLPPVGVLPSGYRVRPAADPARRAAVHRAAFGSDRLSTSRYVALTGLEPYRTDLDLVVETTSGEYVAYCLGWYDETTRVGEIEPLGVHPDHRRRGLGAAVSVAVLHALAAAGATRALVYARGDAAHPAPKALYESLGFTAHALVHSYAPAG